MRFVINTQTFFFSPRAQESQWAVHVIHFVISINLSAFFYLVGINTLKKKQQQVSRFHFYYQYGIFSIQYFLYLYNDVCSLAPKEMMESWRWFVSIDWKLFLSVCWVKVYNMKKKKTGKPITFLLPL